MEAAWHAAPLGLAGLETVSAARRQILVSEEVAIAAHRRRELAGNQLRIGLIERGDGVALRRAVEGRGGSRRREQTVRRFDDPTDVDFGLGVSGAESLPKILNLLVNQLREPV